MRFSRKFKASSHCLPSPDGRLVATLLPTGIHIQAVDRLEEFADVIELPTDLSVSAIVSFQWSPTSQRVLVATADQILVAAVLASTGGEEKPFRAVIRNPSLPVVAKPAFVGFGPSDDQVCLCSAYGVKFAVFSLLTGKTVEILNPKLFSSVSVFSRGFSFRPDSNHLSLLTRTAGKDWVSVHDPAASTPIASWAPDTIDAQGLVWSPDGHWLTVWESPAYGRKILFYTPDGYIFKTWTGVPHAGATRQSNGDGDGGYGDFETHIDTHIADELLGSGVRLVQYSANARILAVGDVSRTVRLIDVASITTYKRLVHPTSLRPRTSASSMVSRPVSG
ncbi:hypothetical protein HMPREF1624_04352 [Sporothrix schenckii ATCC 58251]|uniref:Anaphase-promoting complex subunit 4 WD40 domain-containing protein n=1 Tax=Sporothrix schenckii (strain ATCC 58251 / de Perez 2211183) TaxID=1391915 RepID=U7PW46_SPOS1|nr:hypothetical protein HMPREF1624_04352 [Sporothrix schenckii ATCC 58251]